jgi:formate--tetrahydrofolate ligase
MHGGVEMSELTKENLPALEKGCANLVRHIENVKSFGVPVIVAVNRFTADTDAEIDLICRIARDNGVTAVACTHWSDGGAGAEELAREVAALVDRGQSNFAPLYPDNMPLWQKIRTVATRLYRADDIIADKKVRDEIRQLEALGYGDLPVCIAKTQYSFSSDPSLKNAPDNHVLPVREVRLAAGAGFLVVVCGDIMTMPGLPREPAANRIGLDEEGKIVGLF